MQPAQRDEPDLSVMVLRSISGFLRSPLDHLLPNFALFRDLFRDVLPGHFRGGLCLEEFAGKICTFFEGVGYFFLPLLFPYSMGFDLTSLAEERTAIVAFRPRSTEVCTVQKTAAKWLQHNLDVLDLSHSKST